MDRLQRKRLKWIGGLWRKRSVYHTVYTCSRSKRLFGLPSTTCRWDKNQTREKDKKRQRQRRRHSGLKDRQNGYVLIMTSSVDIVISIRTLHAGVPPLTGEERGARDARDTIHATQKLPDATRHAHTDRGTHWGVQGQTWRCHRLPGQFIIVYPYLSPPPIHYYSTITGRVSL